MPEGPAKEAFKARMAAGRKKAAKAGKKGKGRRGAASAAKAPKAKTPRRGKGKAASAPRRKKTGGPAKRRRSAAPAVASAAALEKVVAEAVAKAMPAKAAKPRKKPKKRKRASHKPFRNVEPLTRTEAALLGISMPRATKHAKHGKVVKHTGLGPAGHYWLKHQKTFLGLTGALGAVSVYQMDSLIPYRPLGARVEPSYMVAVGTLVAAYAVRRWYKKGSIKSKLISNGLVAAGAGTGLGILMRATARRSGAAVSGTDQAALPPEP